MQLSQMRYFIEVARTKNISLAAKNLHLSQPYLSFAIKSLEKELGVALLIRKQNLFSSCKYNKIKKPFEKFKRLYKITLLISKAQPN